MAVLSISELEILVKSECHPVQFQWWNTDAKSFDGAGMHCQSIDQHTGE